MACKIFISNLFPNFDHHQNKHQRTENENDDLDKIEKFHVFLSLLSLKKWLLTFAFAQPLNNYGFVATIDLIIVVTLICKQKFTSTRNAPTISSTVQI